MANSRSKLTPADVAAARRNIRRGSSKAKEAARLGVSARALGFAFDRHPEEDPRRRAAATQADEPQDEDDAPGEAAELGLSDDMSLADQRLTVINQLRQSEKARDELYASGDLSESRRYAELALKASSVLARLNRLDHSDQIVFPKSEVANLRALARSRFDAMCNAHEGLVCARCRVDIATQWAANPLTAPAPTLEEGDQ